MVSNLTRSPWICSLTRCRLGRRCAGVQAASCHSFFRFQSQPDNRALILVAGQAVETPSDVSGLGSVLAPAAGTRLTPSGLEAVHGGC